MMPWLRRTASIVLVLAIVASVAHAGARLTWHMTGETAAPVPPPLLRAEAPPPPDIAPILDFAPFGERISETPIEQPPAPAPTRAIDLDGLRLTGIILAVPATDSLAMIEDRSDPAATYAVGDAVRQTMTLDSVNRDHVILKAGSATATLRFTDPEEARLAGIARLRAQIPAQFRGPSGGAAAAMAAPKGLAPAGSTPEAAIDHYRRRIAANPQTVLDDLGVTLTGQGYRISEDAPRAVLRSGLRAGDVITKVNGTAVGNIEDDRRSFETVAASGRARVEILRDGRVIVLSFPLR